MQTKKIQCPNCKVVLEVRNSKNEEVKKIVCPQCKTVLKVKFPPQQAPKKETPKEPLEAKTFIAAPKKVVIDNGATRLGGSGYGSTQLVTPKEEPVKNNPKVRLVFEERPYLLEEGQNIVGRKGNTSKATIQIPTDDRYMSRQHCCITVKTLSDGTKKVVLSNYQNKNSTAVDGQEIATGDEIRLTNGNRITMGHTTVTFKNS